MGPTYFVVLNIYIFFFFNLNQKCVYLISGICLNPPFRCLMPPGKKEGSEKK